MTTTTLEAPERIETSNVGPITGQFAVDLDGAGVYELRGRKGTGKSTLIRCVESLITGHAVDLTVSDGELDGNVKGFGRIVPIGNRKRAKGEFEAEALDSERFGISDITDPPVKDPAKADAHVIKALASLTRAVADPTAYYPLVGGREQFEALVTKAKTETDDPVLLASRIKECFDAAARLAESQSNTETGHAQSCQEAAQGIDLEGESDSKKLALAAEQAARDAQRVYDAGKAADLATKTAAEARAKLETARKGYKGKASLVAKADWNAAKQARHAAEIDLDKAQKALEAAKAALSVATTAEETAEDAFNAAEQHVTLIEQLNNLIASQEAITKPTDEQASEASQRLAAARLAQENGVRIRDARKSLEKAQRHLDAAQEAANRAEQLRNAARATFDVLTRSVHLAGLKIESVDGNPRLIVEHPNRKGRKTLFSELSDGERTLAALRLLTTFLTGKSDGRPIVFPISQRLWQDLPNSDRKAIDAEARARGIFVFAGLVDDGPLRVERYAA